MPATYDPAVARTRLLARKAELEAARVASAAWTPCITCGEDIAPARLVLGPSAATCIACAQTRD